MSQRALVDWALAARRDRERDAARAWASGTDFGSHSIAWRFGRAIQHAEVKPCIDHIRHILAEIAACDEQQRMLSFSASHKLPPFISNQYRTFVPYITNNIANGRLRNDNLPNRSWIRLSNHHNVLFILS